MKSLMTFAALAVALPTVAHASERNTSNYPHGAENWTAGVLPPPGTYLLSYSNYATYDRLNDEKGRNQVPDFKVDAYAQVTRTVHVTKLRILGASYAVQAIVPVVDLNVRAGGMRDGRTGVGDVIIDPFILGWRVGDLHVTTGIDIFLPTGAYDRTRLANIGRNHVSFEPIVAFSYLPKNGWDVSMKVMYDVNTRNEATDYRSGQEFHVDYAIGKTMRNGLGLGVGGYLIEQTTNDDVDGVKFGEEGNKGRAFAIGPTVRYQAGKLLLIGAWQHEAYARNRPQGDKIWLRVIAKL